MNFYKFCQFYKKKLFIVYTVLVNTQPARIDGVREDPYPHCARMGAVVQALYRSGNNKLLTPKVLCTPLLMARKDCLMPAVVQVF